MNQYHVAVIGAGPAGLYAARKLAEAGARVALLNRDIKPGGLAEYGIYHDKYTMKEGLRKQFRRILEHENITYLGNVTVGEDGLLALRDLQSLGFSAILVTVGAQGTKWLGLEGENLSGVSHAKDIVYHYNHLPPYSQQKFTIGKRAALVGVGNVMVDIAHWLCHDIQVESVTAVARRGPAEVKFTQKEFEHIAAYLDVPALDAELERVRGRVEAVKQDINAARAFILTAQKKADPKVSDTRFAFAFLSSPKRILGDDSGRVRALEVEDTALALRDNGDTKTISLGTTRTLDVDTVIFCIGDRVDDRFGLPVRWNEFVKNPAPRYPINGVSYEAYDPEKEAPIEGVFVAGWARQASSGLVGIARKDGESGAQAVLEYLQTQSPPGDDPLGGLLERLAAAKTRVIHKADWQRLESIEQAEAERRNLPIFKFDSNEEMFAALQRENP
ncbi:MAG: FAD-dependent oxidoreductase [Anaerolineales bacterium]